MSLDSTKSLKPVARNLRKQDTWAEKLLWTWLRDRRFSTYKFRRQHAFGSYVLDFFCVEAFLNIELDGSQHGYPKQKAEDEARDTWLAKAGVKVLRFWNSRLKKEQEFIRETIWRELQARAPHPLPDYCRPLTQAANVQAAVQASETRSSPPLQPPLPGRGRNAHRLQKKPVAGLAQGASEEQESISSPFPLPKGEGQGEGKQDIQSDKVISKKDTPYRSTT
jgi:very-short-patch-repair endonuclease